MLKDRFGNEVFVGCTVAYPGRQSSSVWITTGVVVEVIDERPTSRNGWVRPPRLRLDGGSRGDRRQLGRRTIAWSDDVIVLGGMG